MTVYRTDLTGDHHRLIAHLLPGDRLVLTWSAGEKTINADPDLPWIEVFDTDPIPRICRYGTEAGLTQNTLVRQRPPITEAARAVRPGGAVYVSKRAMTSRYPLSVVFERGRVQHSAREHNGHLITLCGARGASVTDPPELPWCKACANKPNPIDNRSRGVTVGEVIIALVPGAEGAGIKP